MSDKNLNLSLFLQSNSKGQELVSRLSDANLDIYYKIQDIVYTAPTTGEIHRQVTKLLESGYGREFSMNHLGNPKIGLGAVYSLSNMGAGNLNITKESYDANPYLKDKSRKTTNDLTLDNYKRDKKGRIKTKKGKPVKVNAAQRKMNAFINGFANLGGIANFFVFLKENLIIIAILFVTVFIIVPAIIFTAGAVGAFHSTPFELCSKDSHENSGSSAGLGDGITLDVKKNVEKYSKPEFLYHAWVYFTQKAGWSKNATIGTLSYIMQEGSGLGTFTYESYYIKSYKGPSGKSPDLTLDNELWLKELPRLQHENPDGDMVGIGAQQQTDTSAGGGAQNATAMIKAAISAKKYWQDPSFQVPYLIKLNESNYMFQKYNYKSDQYSALEWCNIITGAIGMPAWGQAYGAAGADNYYYRDHSRHLPKAEAAYNQYKDKNLDQFDLGDPTRATNTGACSDAHITGNKALNGTGEWPKSLKARKFKGNEVPPEAEQFIHFRPEKYGIGWGDYSGWVHPDDGGQCVHLVEALGNAIWGNTGITVGNGNQQAQAWAAKFGGTTSKQPALGAISSVNLTGTFANEGHTYIVQHVFANGDILVTEQNWPGWSGDLNGTPRTWNYSYITKAEYEANTIFYAPPGKTPKESK